MVVYRYCIVGPRRCTSYIIIYIYIYIVTIGSLLNFLDCSILGLFLEVSSSCFVCFLQDILQAGITDNNYQFPNQGIYKCHHSKAFPNLYLLSISVSEAVPSYSSFGRQAIAHLVQCSLGYKNRHFRGRPHFPPSRPSCILKPAQS